MVGLLDDHPAARVDVLLPLVAQLLDVAEPGQRGRRLALRHDRLSGWNTRLRLSGRLRLWLRGLRLHRLLRLGRRLASDLGLGLRLGLLRLRLRRRLRLRLRLLRLRLHRLLRLGRWLAPDLGLRLRLGLLRLRLRRRLRLGLRLPSDLGLRLPLLWLRLRLGLRLCLLLGLRLGLRLRLRSGLRGRRGLGLRLRGPFRAGMLGILAAVGRRVLREHDRAGCARAGNAVERPAPLRGGEQANCRGCRDGGPRNGSWHSDCQVVGQDPLPDVVVLPPQPLVDFSRIIGLLRPDFDGGDKHSSAEAG
jgi:hypothetical protein